MIPPPKLDDRTFQDIVDEAIRLIPRYAPEWTNHNPSDPGITILELAAWMTDLLIKRVNQVPEKNYVAFLNLLGVRLRPPRSARALVQFRLVEQGERQLVPRGTQLSTPQGADGEPIHFETARDITVTNAAPDRCFSYFGDTYADNSRYLLRPHADAFDVFGGAQRVERFLFISDPRFENAGEASILRIFLGCPEAGGRDLARVLEWEYFDGGRWVPLQLAPIDVDRGEAAFFGPLRFAPTAINHIDGLWIRGRLAEIPANTTQTEIETVRARVEVAGEGLLPELAYTNLDSNAFLPLDISKSAFVFGKEPKTDCVFYLACDELTRTPDAYLGLEIQLADPAIYASPAASDKLALAWEYWDGKRWRSLGRANARGVLPGAGDEHGFHDETCALTKSGTIAFRRPKDMESCEVSGEIKRWIRCRLESGDYGVAGTYSMEDDKWIFKDDRPLRPPVVKALTIRYREDYRDVKRVLSYNDFHFADHTETARAEFAVFQPFFARAEESPTCYVGFPKRPANDKYGIYFAMEEELGLGSLPADENSVVTPELAKYESLRRHAWEQAQRVVWEYWNGKQWETVVVDDETQAFTSSGMMFFVPPDDWQLSDKFSEQRYWLRARLEMGGYVRLPRARGVLVNCIDAFNHRTFGPEVLGSSDGTPLQAFTFLRGPLLEDEVLEIYEREPAADATAHPSRPAYPDDPARNESWVRWTRVDSFFASGPDSRHYLLDYATGQVSFGDGRQGRIPPESRNGIVARRYRIGGGAAGNVNAGTLTTMGRSLAYIQGVVNPLPATGGADRESLDDAKARAPFAIKSRDRAVTTEDFEMLALRASPTLARAKCVADKSHRGQVTLVLVPKAEARKFELDRPLAPSNEVLRYVKRYLDERRLVGTVLSVIKPRYRDLAIRVVLLRRSVGTSERVRKEIDVRVKRYLHALVGGRAESGWEFGRPVLKTELIHVVEEIPGVEGVDHLEIRDESRGVTVEHVRLDEDELPFVASVTVAEKVREDIR